MQKEAERSEAAVDRLALGDQSAGHVSAHGGKLRALPASDGKPVNHDSSATAEEAAPHVARASTPGLRLPRPCHRR